MTYKTLRQKWIPQIVLDLARPGSIIDIGAGNQIYRPHTTGLQYTSLDSKAFEKSGEVFQNWTAKPDIVADLSYPLPIADKTYKYALCTEVLEHVPNPVFSLREICRIIEPNGLLILSAPTKCDPHMEPYIFTSGFFIHWYNHWFDKFAMKIIDQKIHQDGLILTATRTGD